MLCFIAVHLILGVICYNLWFGKNVKYNKNDIRQFLVSNYLLFFNVSEPVLCLKYSEQWKSTIFKMNLSHAFQNILMLITSLFVRIEACDLTNLNESKPIAISCIVRGLAMANIWCLLYIKCLRSGRVGPNNISAGSGNDVDQII